MISKELISLLLQVVSSWQVIAVTVVIVLYVSLISYVARLYHRPRFVSPFPARRKKKKDSSSRPADSVTESAAEKSSNDELGLEE